MQLMWKWMGLFLRKNNILRSWGWLSLLNWIGALTLSLLLKLPPRKLMPWLVLWSSVLLRLLLSKSTIGPCMKYCCHVWPGGPSSSFLLGIIRQATKMDMQDCWSFMCCLCWTLGSLLKCSQCIFSIVITLANVRLY